MKNNPHFVFNASNLQGGGAVQVAVSLIFEFSKTDEKKNITLVLSSIVARECAAVGVDLTGFAAFHQIDLFGFKLFHKKLRKILNEAEIVFSVFGPLYLICNIKNHIVGFAQPWILYPENEVYNTFSPIKKFMIKGKYALQRLAFRLNSDLLVVEAEHARRQLVKLFPGLRISVVPNALNAVFLDAIATRTVLDDFVSTERSVPKNKHTLCLGYIGRAYPHKNIGIFPDVRQALRDNHGIDATIKVTLTETEWQAQSATFRENTVNVGALSLNDCAAFYETLDGIIFPSLLESFSATPLETMAMGVPLFASDRAFVSDFCGDIPFYFDPLDPFDIAAAIARASDLPALQLATRLEAGKNHVLALPNARERAGQISAIIETF